jgi:hypothetical protein
MFKEFNISKKFKEGFFMNGIEIFNNERLQLHLRDRKLFIQSLEPTITAIKKTEKDVYAMVETENKAQLLKPEQVVQVNQMLDRFDTIGNRLYKHLEVLEDISLAKDIYEHEKEAFAVTVSEYETLGKEIIAFLVKDL